MRTTKRCRKWISRQKHKRYMVQLEKLLSPYKEQYDKVNKQLFRDMLTADTCMVHVDDTETRIIVPYSTEYWNIKDKIEYNKHVEKHGYPPPISTQVTMMTTEELKEKYDIQTDPMK